MLMNALYEIGKNGHKTVGFVTSDQVLREQLKKDITAILPSFQGVFSFGHTDAPDSIIAQDVMIIDEADQCLEKLVTFDDDTGELNGLFNMTRVKKCYFFSATMPDYFKHIVGELNGAYKDLEFKSQYQLSTDAMEPYQITGHLVKNEIYNRRVCEWIRSRKDWKDGKPKPMMIFVEEEDPDLIEQLKAATLYLFPKQPMLEVKEAKDIGRLQTMLRQVPEGVVLIPKKYGRGINLRFQKDALVIVLVNKEYIGFPLVKQMVGRSSRRQGLCYGEVFITTQFDMADSQVGALEVLKEFENDYANDEGLMIVSALFKKVEKLSPAMKISLKEIVGKAPMWRTTREEFAMQKTKFLKFLKDPNFVPDVDWQ